MRPCEARRALFVAAILAATCVAVSLAAYQTSLSSSTTTTTRIITTSSGPQNNNKFGGANGIGSLEGGGGEIGGSESIRFRSNKLRRLDSCRENLPLRSEDLPALVITGRVKEVYMAPVAQDKSSNYSSTSVSPDGQQQSTVYVETRYVVSSSSPPVNKALVNIGRVFKGDPQLVNSDIIIGGFNSSSSNPCPNYVKPNDTYIMLLEREGDRIYSIQGANLLSMNLNNLDRINAIATNQPYRIRGPIEDILCEKHYCAYGRCKANDYGMVSCHCPASCPPSPTPVCGSDNKTYQSECHLIMDGCSRQKPLFVTKEGAC